MVDKLSTLTAKKKPQAWLNDARLAAGRDRAEGAALIQAVCAGRETAVHEALVRLSI